ncbi:RNA polymerase II-associated factor 1 [Blattella germanica]|nr:RNA polymerase II-associated factor 1 [Blattella germanica]
MPPTIQNPLTNDKRPVRQGEKRSELVCRVKYCNTLPDIPFDPKFITYPFESTRFIQYNPTSLERNYKYEVLTEHDLGVTIDLINRDTYATDSSALLDPADEKLLEEDVLTPQDSKRSRHHARSVSWLRRTEYISTEQTRFQPQTMDKVEAKVGYSIKKSLKANSFQTLSIDIVFQDETLFLDRDNQIKAIEKTFEDSKKPIEKHYSKPNVVPLEVLPVYPDFKVWKYPCAQVIFDSDPAPTGRSVPAQIEEMSQAMIRVRLSKRRQKIGQQPNNTRLVVKHRPLNAQEFRMQRYRERQLEPPGEEEEEEDDEEEEQQAQAEQEGSKSGDEERDGEAVMEGEGGGSGSEDERARSKSSGSRSSSPGSQKSRSRSPSRSRSRSRSKSVSRSRSRSRSGSRSGSPNKSDSASGSGSGSSSGSGSDSDSGEGEK